MEMTSNADITQEAFFAIVQSEVNVWDGFEEALQLEGLPISVGRFIPLHCLVGQPLRLRELSHLAHAKESAMSRMVERMVKDGLVEKARDGADGRAVSLRITEEGRRMEAQAREVFSRYLQGLFDGLTGEELALLCSLLSRISAARGKACA